MVPLGLVNEEQEKNRRNFLCKKREQTSLFFMYETEQEKKWPRRETEMPVNAKNKSTGLHTCVLSKRVGRKKMLSKRGERQRKREKEAASFIQSVFEEKRLGIFFL